MKARKIDLMHQLFGYGIGKCGECSHFGEQHYDKIYYKCKLYGCSCSEATDWRRKYDACGMKNKKPNKELKPIVSLVSRTVKGSSETEGQISLPI